MSAFVPKTTPTANLPHLSKIDRKPKPIGMEFKCVADGLTGMMLHLEIARGEKEMGGARYVDTCKKASTACCLRLTDGTERKTNHVVPSMDQKPMPRQTFLGDSWFRLW